MGYMDNNFYYSVIEAALRIPFTAYFGIYNFEIGNFNWNSTSNLCLYTVKFRNDTDEKANCYFKKIGYA